MAVIRRSVAGLVPILIALGARAVDTPRACVPPEGLSIGGIGLADTRATVVAKLGEPRTTRTYDDEDDGGRYTGTTLIYPQLEVDVDDLRGIERIAGTGPDIAFPLGLRAGMSLQQVGNALHFVPGPLDEGTISLPVCGVDEDLVLSLQFTDGALQSVEILSFGP